VPHIHWRKITFDSSGKTFDRSDEVVKNLRPTNFRDNAIDSLVDSSSNNLGVSECIKPEF